MAYSYRFKIELTFKSLKDVLGSFCYRFWTAFMPKLIRKNHVDLTAITDAHIKRRIADTANAIEGFVNFGCIALGMTQIIALALPQNIWSRYIGWLRTKRTIVLTEEIVRSVIQEDFYHNFSDFSNTAIYRIITRNQRRTKYLYHDGAA